MRACGPLQVAGRAAGVWREGWGGSLEQLPNVMSARSLPQAPGNGPVSFGGANPSPGARLGAQVCIGPQGPGLPHPTLCGTCRSRCRETPCAPKLQPGAHSPALQHTLAGTPPPSLIRRQACAHAAATQPWLLRFCWRRQRPPPPPLASSLGPPPACTPTLPRRPWMSRCTPRRSAPSGEGRAVRGEGCLGEACLQSTHDSCVPVQPLALRAATPCPRAALSG